MRILVIILLPILLFAFPSQSYIDAKIKNKTRETAFYETKNSKYNYIIITSYADLRYYLKYYDICNLGLKNSSKRQKVYNKIIIKNVKINLEKYCKETNFGTQNTSKFNKIYNSITIKNAILSTYKTINVGIKSTNTKNIFYNNVEIKNSKISKSKVHLRNRIKIKKEKLKSLQGKREKWNERNF